MSATVLLWKSHRGGFFNFGHASLALSYEDEMSQSRLATITWYPHPTAKQTCSGNPNRSAVSSVSTGTPKHWHPANLQSELHNFAQKPTQEIRELRKQKPLNQEQTERLNNLKQWYPRIRQYQQTVGSEWINPFMNASDERGRRVAEQVLNTRICPPSETVSIPTINDPDTIVGLNDVAMYEWWNTFSGQKKRYNLLTRNCSAAVGGALLAGGAHAFVDPPKMRSWTPSNVTQWAKEVRKEVLKIQQKFNAAKQDIESKRGKADQSAAKRYVWSVGEFKRNSKGKSMFASRYEELKNVDKALEFYHQLRFRTDPQAVKRNMEILALVGIIIRLEKVINKNRGSQRESHRLKGLVTLGLQVLKRINQLKQQQQRGEHLKEEYSRLIAQLNADLHTNLRSLRSINLALGWAINEEREVSMTKNVKDVLNQIVKELGKEPTFVQPNPNNIMLGRDWHAPDRVQQQFSNPFQLQYDSMDDSDAEHTPPPNPQHTQQNFLQPWQVPQRNIMQQNAPVTVDDFLKLVDDGSVE